MDKDYVCSLPDCTMGTTGKCLRSYDPAHACPHIVTSTTKLEEPVDRDEALSYEDDEVGRYFPSGNELGKEEANDLMQSSYTHLIGVLGSTNSGKTCFLTSLYLLLSLGKQTGYYFAGSETLPGFESRARGLRKWPNGALADQLVPHTVLQDARNPSLMHIALVKTDDPSKTKLNLLLTDLPGEWSDTLIDSSETADRFEFLKMADGIIIIIEGPLLAVAKTRHIEIQKIRVLLHRLSKNVQIDIDVPVVLLVTKADQIDMSPPEGLSEIERIARSIGFSPVTILSIAFSRKPEIFPSGIGIIESVNAIINKDWPLTINKEIKALSSNTRSFMTFRHFERKES